MTVLTYFLIQRRGTPVQRDPNSVERAVGALRTSIAQQAPPVRMTLDMARRQPRGR